MQWLRATTPSERVLILRLGWTMLMLRLIACYQTFKVSPIFGTCTFDLKTLGKMHLIWKEMICSV
jgi:hypothetical protein